MKIIFVIALVGSIVGLLIFADTQTKRLSALQDCITKTAIEEGYADNSASKEAWELFISECK